MNIVITGLTEKTFKKVLDSKFKGFIEMENEGGIPLYNFFMCLDSDSRFSINNISPSIVRIASAIDDSVLYLHTDEFLEVRIS